MSTYPDTRPFFTVVTPTFNRAHTLPRVFASLSEQSFRDFEWIVIDDGSSDDTRRLVADWIEAAPFPVRYFYQPNSGKASAENRATTLARGSLLAVLDSDDWYVPDALRIFAEAWASIDPGIRNRFAGVVGLCADPRGTLVEDPFPADVLDTDYTELRSRYRVRGDKTGCMRVDVAKRFPYPLFEGERRGGFESTVLRRIAREYRCRCVNRIVKTVEYQADGISAAGGRVFADSPRSAKLAVLEALLDDDLSPISRANYAHYFRFSLHARAAGQGWAECPSKLMWLATAPIGTALYVRDRLRYRGNERTP